MMMYQRTVFGVIVMLLLSQRALAQSDTMPKRFNAKRAKAGSYSSPLNTSSERLAKSISDEESDAQIAADYYNVAQELVKRGDYLKAEGYLQKAVQYQEKISSKKNAGKYYRELARVQEMLKKKGDAEKNYEQAARVSLNDTLRQINMNDAIRLRQAGAPEKELEYLDKNAELLDNSTYKSERVQTYTQRATTNAILKKQDEALKDYKNALGETEVGSTESNEIKSSIADILAEKKQYKEAISLQQEVVAESDKAGGVDTRVQQMRKLSDLYFAGNSVQEGVQVLQDAYGLAVEKGNLKEARNSVLALIAFYEKNKQNQQALHLYKEFLTNLDTLIAKDSSLVDAKLFQFSEEKIAQLEKEQVLKDELIARKNSNNTLLIFSLLLLLGLLGIIIKAWYSIRRRNKQIALQSLRREMNPHFLFNSLNSVNQFIASNNELEANKYLTSYSNLMRRVMENSNKDYVTLAVELEQITKYLELEKLRFADKFDYEIEMDAQLETDAEKVPNMLIQPNLENAIWHGLRYRNSKGLLKVHFKREGKKTQVVIDDNGIGLRQSREIKTRNQKLYESRGLQNVEERIRLLNEIGDAHIEFEMKEKEAPETGVRVKISW